MGKAQYSKISMQAHSGHVQPVVSLLHVVLSAWETSLTHTTWQRVVHICQLFGSIRKSTLFIDLPPPSFPKENTKNVDCCDWYVPTNVDLHGQAHTHLVFWKAKEQVVYYRFKWFSLPAQGLVTQALWGDSTFPRFTLFTAKTHGVRVSVNKIDFQKKHKDASDLWPQHLVFMLQKMLTIMPDP